MQFNIDLPRPRAQILIQSEDGLSLWQIMVTDGGVLKSMTEEACLREGGGIYLRAGSSWRSLYDSVGEADLVYQ